MVAVHEVVTFTEPVGLFDAESGGPVAWMRLKPGGPVELPEVLTFRGRAYRLIGGRYVKVAESRYVEISPVPFGSRRRPPG